MIKIYSKGALLKELKKQNLPASYKHLMKLERLKIIPLPGKYEFVGIIGRAYSQAEVQRIIEQVRKDQERKKQKHAR